MTETTKQTKQIQTVVTFAAAAKPYHHAYEPEAAANEVLTDALASFHISADGTTRYYLLHAGDEVGPADTLGQLVAAENGHPHELTLALRTETISGGR
jgi:hypothetical protein